MSNEDTKNLKRPPVVVVVGHVDHGKTALLDCIRKTNVIAKEAGGITQSVGAYEIEVPTSTKVESGSRPQASGRITFIDTPGHEAFSKMRARGAKVADIAILVVAADEGVKPQTKEAIKVLQESETPFIAAITKIDKPNADVERAKNDLAANGVLLEGYGGNVSNQGVSSKTGEGINELLDLVLLAADVEDLRYNPESLAGGMVLETKMDSRRGATVTVILKDGLLGKGDLIVTPTAKGKVKILEDFLGKPAKELSPSSPAVILGFESLPQIGEEFRAGDLSEEELIKVMPLPKKIEKREIKEGQVVRLILKADVAGSLEALNDLLNKLPLKENQRLEIISESVGEISDGDVKDALATNATIVGFRTGTNRTAENLARERGVVILTDEIIYKLAEKIQNVFSVAEEGRISGELEILALFSAAKNRQTIGGKVTGGQIKNKSRLEIKRGEEIIGRGKVLNLQQKKTDVAAVGEGNECGLIFESDVKVEVGDKLLSK